MHMQACEANGTTVSQTLCLLLGDVRTKPVPGACTMTVAKDSLNNLSWSSLVHTFEAPCE